MKELESVLAEVEKTATSVALPPIVRPSAPVAVVPCISCGTSVTSFSEQTCIVCDRPMCDACLDQSVIGGRPAICPNCYAHRGT